MSLAPAVGVDALLVGVAGVALWLGALRFVESATRLARRIGLSDLVVGLTVVALGTSAPEAAVTIDAALTGRPTIAVANIVGSNLFNLGLVLGAVALVRAVHGSPSLVRRDGVVVVATSVLVAAVSLDGTVRFVEGTVLFGGFLAYLGLLFRQADRGVAPEVSDRRTRLPTPVWLVVGFALVVGGANLLVASAADLAGLLGASEWLVGETVVAVGTSAPEIAASVAAARRGLGDVAAGNLVGSSIFNALGVLGFAAVIVPLPVGPEATLSLGWLVGLSALAVGLLASGGRLSRPEGAVLVVVALLNWLVDLL